MIAYHYRARDGAGVLHRGSGVAGSAGALSSALRADGLQPITIRRRLLVDALGQLNAERPRRRVRRDHILLFAIQLQAMCEACVPLAGGLRALTAETTDPALRHSLLQVGQDLDAGRGLADALARHPHCFDALFVAMTRLGEETGQLARALTRLIRYSRQEQATRRQLVKASLYPLCVLAGVTIAMAIFMTAVIPGFAAVFERFDAPLPLATQVLVAVSTAVTDHWAALTALCVLLLGSWQAATLHPTTAQWRDRLRLQVPIAGPLRLLAAQSRVARCLAMARGAGVSLPQTLDLAALTADNRHLAARLRGMRTALLHGRTLSDAAAASGVLGGVSLQMLRAGEDSGRLDALIEELANYQETELEQRLATLSGAIGPVLTLGLSLLTLVVALGVVLPIWELNTVVSGRR